VSRVVGVLFDDIAQVHADAEMHAPLGRKPHSAALETCWISTAAATASTPLANSGEQRIAQRVHHPTVVVLDDAAHRRAIGGEGFDRGRFVGSHQPRVAHDVRAQNRRELAMGLVVDRHSGTRLARGSLGHVLPDGSR